MYIELDRLCIHAYNLFLLTVPVAKYHPEGPQIDVAFSDIHGWKQCYQKSLDDKITDTEVESIKEGCSALKVMMACYQEGEDKVTLLAWSDREDVFGVTDGNDCGVHGNFKYWYKWKHGWRHHEKEEYCDQRKCQRGACDIDPGWEKITLDHWDWNHHRGYRHRKLYTLNRNESFDRVEKR